jgi:PKD repeat protein
MKKNPPSQSAFLNVRVLSALALCSLGVMLGALSFAATPSSGTLTDTSGPKSYNAGPFFVANQTPVPFVDQGPECLNPFQPCDDYALTVTLPAGYAAAHPNAAIKVTLGWVDAGSGQSDYDLYIYPNPDPDCSPTDCSSTDGSEEPAFQSAGSANPEVATISPVQDGTHKYTVKVVPFQPTGETVNVKIELLSGSATGGDPNFGAADPSAPGVPRYQNFYAPSGSSAESGSGEFNIGFNPKSGRIMTMNTGPIWRITPPEKLSPAQPECCEGLWEDVTNLSTITGVDPILWTDQKTGRTFASNSTAGANAVYGYSDNDGDVWVPLAASPPSGGTDHETIGSGPYSASLSTLSTPVNQGEAVYYCSQTWPLGPATCQRSDNLGASYGPGVFAYYGNGVTQCHGLHGHVHVAPDGTAWLPVKGCGSSQGGALSTDGGTTWKEFLAPGTKPQSAGADPSIGIDSNNTVYYCYVNNEPVAAGQAPEGHPRVKVGHRNADNTVTWTYDVDIGASHGIKNTVHPEAVGGSAGRAACGFIGTDVAGDYQALNFAGNWYAFIATTYDGGQTWTTVNATSNDPVQRHAGIWQGGGSHTQRNLLDFNEITVDSKGRALYGYSDGCVSAGCIAGTAANDFTAFMRVARQSGGKTLFASNDANTDTITALAPKPPCLSGTRDQFASHLTWQAPDNGGADITGYQILRGTASGAETVLVANTGTDKTTYDDTTANPAVAHYFYKVKAINSVGASTASNEVNLAVVAIPQETACVEPGLTKLRDPAGDATATLIGGPGTPTPPGTDLLAFQIAQPYAADGVVRLVFTINTDPGQSPQPVGSSWYVSMKIPDPAPATTFHYKAVHMTWNGTTPVFESYTPGTSNAGTTDGRFVTAGTQKPAEASSGYTAPFDKVVIVVKATDLGLSPGASIAGFVSGVSQTAGGVVTGLYDAMPNSLAYTGTYTVTSNQTCRPNNPPTAVLKATPTSGNAPLTVNFDGSGSYDPDTAPPADTIASYTFKFGDGSPSVTQSNPTISHTYNNVGTYAATLAVKDSRGATSENTAEATITVNAPDLFVSTLKASKNQARQGAKIPITATVTNQGQVGAGQSKTGFLLDGQTVIGLVDTPAIARQSTVSVTLYWNTASVPKGNHTIQAIADNNQDVVESDETNNKSGPITIYIQGNKTP